MDNHDGLRLCLLVRYTSMYILVSLAIFYHKVNRLHGQRHEQMRKTFVWYLLLFCRKRLAL